MGKTGAGVLAVAWLFAGCGAGEVLYDFDGDGALDGDDCAPGDPSIYPGAEDLCGDGIDQDCDDADSTAGDWCGMRLFPGEGSACALKPDGTAVCWGSGVAPPEDRFVHLAVGYGWACGITLDDNRILCWGGWTLNSVWSGESYQELPNGSFVRVVAGKDHGCALRQDGEVRCWAYFEEGIDERIEPPPGPFDSLAAQSETTCGHRVEGGLACWSGHGWFPEEVSDDLSPFVVGDIHGCGLTPEGEAVVFGSNDADLRNAPDERWVEIAASYVHTCGRTEEGQVHCWGTDSKGYLDPPEASYLHIAASYNYTCGITEEGRIECWGGSNQLGAASPPFSP